jgi:hypothetical protein
MSNFYIKGGRYVGFYSTILCIMSTIYHCKTKLPNSKFTVDNHALHYGGWNNFLKPIWEFNCAPDLVLQDTQAWYHYIKNDTPPNITFIKKLREISLPYFHYSDQFLNYFNSFSLIQDYITIHFRGANGIQHKPHVLEERYTSILQKKCNNTKNILICTDDEDAVNNFAKLLKDKNIIHLPTHTKRGGEIHISDTVRQDDKVELGLEVMRDSLLMSKGLAVIGKGSNVSSFAKVLNNDLIMYRVD